MRGDWADEARRFESIDHAVLAEIEGRDAIAYRERRGRWPENLSRRTWEWIKQQTIRCAEHGEVSVIADEAFHAGEVSR